MTKALTTNVSDNFVKKMLSEIAFPVTDEQKDLIQGYFIQMDKFLTDNGIAWKDVIVDYKLAQDLMVCAQIGFDMRSEAMLYPVARKDGKAGGKYRFSVQKGYKGRIFEATKYAVGKIVDIDAHLVYENDQFTPHFKDANHPFDTFEFNPPKNVFVDRGKLVGGFAYITYENQLQNKLVVMSKADIDKRKNTAVAKAIWNAWYEEMAMKTLYIAAAKAVPKDPSKIDSTYRASQLIDQAQGDEDIQAGIIEAQKAAEVVDLSEPVTALPESTTVDMPVHMTMPKEPEKVPVSQPAADPAQEIMEMDF